MKLISIKTLKLYMTMFTFLLSGCQGLTSFYFFPESDYRITPDQLNLAYQPVTLTTNDHITLENWWLPAQPKEQTSEARGTILFLHGNAENISTHIHSIAWLPRQGYNVFMLDYRGFGRSKGNPKLPEIFQDIDAAALWLQAQESVQDKPLYLLGQSIGAALGATWVSRSNHQEAFNAVVLDAPFASWSGMARYAMSRQWQTWVALPGTYLVSAQWDAEQHIKKLKKPLMVIHSSDDTVIPAIQSRKIYENSPSTKQWLETRGLHVATFGQKKNRETFLQFLENNRS